MMKKIDLKSTLCVVLIIISVLSFGYVNAPVCNKMLKSQGICLSKSEQITEQRAMLPEVELSKQLLLVVKRMLPIHP